MTAERGSTAKISMRTARLSMSPGRLEPVWRDILIDLALRTHALEDLFLVSNSGNSGAARPRGVATRLAPKVYSARQMIDAIRKVWAATGCVGGFEGIIEALGVLREKAMDFRDYVFLGLAVLATVAFYCNGFYMGVYRSWESFKSSEAEDDGGKGASVDTDHIRKRPRYTIFALFNFQVKPRRRSTGHTESSRLRNN